MQLRKKCALLLTGLMTISMVNFAGLSQAYATPDLLHENDAIAYTLSVPSDATITNVGWNEVGDVEVTGTIGNFRDVKVSVVGSNDSKLVSEENNTIDYTIKGSASDDSALTECTFDASSVSSKEAKKTIGIDVEDYTSKPNGKYSGRIDFTLALEDLTYTTRIGTVLHVDDLLNTSSDTVKFYNAPWEFECFNGYIEKAGAVNWYDAKAFVEMLNDYHVDGQSNWRLLNYITIYQWWRESGSPEEYLDGKIDGILLSEGDLQNDERCYYWDLDDAYDDRDDSKEDIVDDAYDTTWKDTTHSHGLLVARYW